MSEAGPAQCQGSGYRAGPTTHSDQPPLTSGTILFIITSLATLTKTEISQFC